MLYAIELKNVWLVLLKVSNFEMSFCVFKSSKKQRNFPSISYYFHIPKKFLFFFPHTGKNRNRRRSNLLP